MKRLLTTVAGQGSFYATVAALVTFAAFPFYWMLLTAFKSDADLYNLKSNPYWFNAAPTLEHIRYLFGETLFLQWIWNSLLIGLCVVAITLIVTLPAGYSLARISGKGAESLGIGIFLTYLVPPTLLFLPLSRVVSLLGLQDSLWSLILVYPTFTPISSAATSSTGVNSWRRR
jgi:multiple sugar transport system permease protein